MQKLIDNLNINILNEFHLWSKRHDILVYFYISGIVSIIIPLIKDGLWDNGAIVNPNILI